MWGCVPARVCGLVVLLLVLSSAVPSLDLAPEVAAVTVNPGVVFQPSQSWANLSFSATQTFDAIVVDSTGVTFDTVRFGAQKFPLGLPRVEILIGVWTPLQTTADATSIRYSATAVTGSIVYFNFTYLLANREYILQVDGVEAARKFTTAAGHVSFPWLVWSTHDFNVLLGPGSGTPPNNCPSTPSISGTPPLTVFVGTSVTFVGTSDDPDGDPLSWIWTWDDGTTTDQSTTPGAGQTTASHAWASAGSYDVTLSVSDAVCDVTSPPFRVDVVPRPAKVGTVAGIVRDAATTAPLSGANVVVSPGAFGQSTDAQGRYSVTVPIGSYTVTASAANYLTGSQSSVVVSENTTATVDFDLTPTAANVVAAFDFTIDGLTVRFVDRTTTDGPFQITSYTWTFGDGTASSEASPTHTYAGAGIWATYSVTLEACDSARHCGNVTREITVANMPLLILVIGSLLALVVAGIAVAIFLLRRRRSKKLDEDYWEL